MSETLNQAMAEAKTSEALASVMENRIKSYGFAGYVYWTHLRLPIEQLDHQNSFMLARGPAYLKAFEVLYFNKKLYVQDPVVHAAMVATAPFTTQEIRKKHRQAATRPQRWLFSLEKRFGFHYDIYIPVHTPLRTQIFYAYFIGNDAEHENRLQKCLADLINDVTLFCACMTDFVVMGAEEYIADIVFSRREQECLTWMAKGRNNREIAIILSISERTVKFHIKNIMEKLDASNRTEAVAIAARSGWLTN